LFLLSVIFKSDTFLKGEWGKGKIDV